MASGPMLFEHSHWLDPILELARQRFGRVRTHLLTRSMDIAATAQDTG